METTKLESTSQNVNETDNKNSGISYSREEIEGTPFTEIRTEEGNYFLVMGDYKLTKDYQNRSQLMNDVGEITKMNWEFMTNVISIMIDQINKFKEFQNEQK